MKAFSLNEEFACFRNVSFSLINIVSFTFYPEIQHTYSLLWKNFNNNLLKGSSAPFKILNCRDENTIYQSYTSEFMGTAIALKWEII